jgi:hypothetical protein
VIDLPFLSLIKNNAEQFPNLFHRFEMIALIAHHVHAPNDAPALKFP